jgi:hypothetical protein
MSRDEDNDPVSIDDVICIADSGKAIRVHLSDGRLFWVPQSQVTAGSEVYGLGHHGTLVVTGWWARKNGLGA